MKQLTFLMAIVSFVLFSCNRQSPTGSLPVTFKGSWRMIAVKDNNSGTITTRPDHTGGDVDLTFTTSTDTSGTFQGHTPSNEIFESGYITGANQQLTIPFLDMTKVGENAWGREFVDNIRSSEQYCFENESKLVITTTEKTLTFQRR